MADIPISPNPTTRTTLLIITLYMAIKRDQVHQIGFEDKITADTLLRKRLHKY